MGIDHYKSQIEINSNHINRDISQFSMALQKSNYLSKIIEDVDCLRNGLTSLHFGLLIFSAYRYQLLKSGDELDIDVNNWESVIEYVNAHKRESLIHSVATKNVNITTSDRYAAIALVSKKISNGKPISICDVGSGFYPTGIGKMIETEYPSAADDTSLKRINKLRCKKLNIKSILATDLNDIDADWTAACIWSDNIHLFELRDILKAEVDNKNDNLRFEVADVTDNFNDIVGTGTQDIISMANVMYQFNSEAKALAFRNIKNGLVNGGWFLSLEYMSGGSRRRPFTYAVFGYRKLKDNLDEPIILAKLDSADCKTILFES